MDSKDSNQFLEEQKVLADAIAGLKEIVRTMKLTIIENETEQKMKSRQFCDGAIGKNWTTFDGSIYHDGNGKLYRVNVTDEGEFDFTPWSYFGSRLSNCGHSEVGNGEKEERQPIKSKIYGCVTGDDVESVFLGIAYGRDFLDAQLNYLKLFLESYIPSWSESFKVVYDGEKLPRERSCDAAVVSIFLASENIDMDSAIDLVDKRTEQYGISGGLIPGLEVGDYLDSDLNIDREIKRWCWDGDNYSKIDLHPTPTSLAEKIQDFNQHLAVKLMEKS